MPVLLAYMWLRPDLTAAVSQQAAGMGGPPVAGIGHKIDLYLLATATFSW